MLKIDELEKGCWYRNISTYVDQTYNWAFKFDYYKIDNNYQYRYYVYCLVDYFLSSNNYENIGHNDVLNFFQGDSFTKIDFSEIVDYLPIRHPDKIFFYRQQKIKYLLNDKN